MNVTSLTQDLQLLENAAKQAGVLAMQWFNTSANTSPAKVWDKGGNHPVTEADLAVDKLLNTTLRQARPKYGWLSEESKDDGSRLKSKRVFVIDPIDGTRAFIKGKPHFSISLAIVENGRPIAGAVYNPALDEMYLAATGQGASANGKAINVRDCKALLNCSMIASDGLFKQKHWRNKWPEMNCESRNSMAYRIALVAAAKFDATLTLRPKSDWDLAAADLIAEEAGAVITDPNGQKFYYNLQSTSKSGVICAGKTVHDLILQQVKQRND
ncbi:MAG: 3'(2'),5'-bisphosphate nucleotidase CysQ [Robiginitomaculum sp.]|nr:3'(2'),5'-bisphosphate nucleotidase CysQ [Robiginitomaculum sp.]